MTAHDGVIGNGAKVTFGGVQINNCMSISVGSTTVDSVEVTTLEDNGQKRYLPSLRDNGSVVVKCLYKEDTRGDLLAMIGQRDTLVVSGPEVTGYELAASFEEAFITELTQPEFTTSGLGEMSVTFKIDKVGDDS
ncbi:hypothetical protein [Limnoglobus roseus]|uniref:Phage tail protein n=1 Tax=Limnoglobus roseus TaxID=2598579 RepID=A0A5C1AE78_9BACT|nr:hypothetical protein [Limnoglobus roseus]QEL16553.1 hypothetical protein PX52LOC_03513 [Limnoglobus roseus]